MNTALEKRSGTLTQAVRTEKALKVARELVRLVPALDAPQFRPLIYNYARLAVLAEAIFAILGEKLTSDQTGEVRASATVYRQIVGEMRVLAHELGLSPTTTLLLAKTAKPILDLEAVRADYAEAETE